jgi:uncharacterized protein YycO
MIEIDHTYHVVELEYSDKSALDWCLTTFGNPNERRWFNRNNKVYFYNAQDHLMFVLRWSSAKV